MFLPVKLLLQVTCSSNWANGAYKSHPFSRFSKWNLSTVINFSLTTLIASTKDIDYFIDRTFISCDLKTRPFKFYRIWTYSKIFIRNFLYPLNYLQKWSIISGGTPIRTEIFRLKSPTFRVSCVAVTPCPFKIIDGNDPLTILLYRHVTERQFMLMTYGLLFVAPLKYATLTL